MSVVSPEPASSEAMDTAGSPTASKAPSTNGSTTSNLAPKSATFPPPKTDKPRPHVCATCMRSFARLEHLKRHERSHTKEKPFECPECTRCFARRDLLLRHQQKLHSATTPASRPRGRRESAAGVANGRVRKNSTANGSGTVRPRANTVSHVDSSTLGMLGHPAGQVNRPFMPGHLHHNSMSVLSGANDFQYRGLASGSHAPYGLPKLDTQGLPYDLSSGLRTAPPYGGFGSDYGMGSMAFDADQGETINPHALHMTGLSGFGVDASGSPYSQMFPGMATAQGLGEDEANFEWMAQGFENQMSFAQANEHAIDDSSPSAMSTNSPNPMNEMASDQGMTTMSNIAAAAAASAHMWAGNNLPAQSTMVNSPVSMDMMSSFSEMVNGANGTVSPKSLLAHGASIDMNFPTTPDLGSVDPSQIQPRLPLNGYQLSLGRDGPASTTSTVSHDSSLRQSSVTTMTSELVNDHIRNVLITGLSLNTGFGQRKYSQPAISSPLSPEGGSRIKGFNINTFPSTHDLQRFVAAYIKFFHPHLPFLHIATLNFESPDYTTPIMLVPDQMNYGQTTVAGGGSCLVLSIAAIGALYEHEMAQSKELFECAKRLISNYLEERRKANMNKTQYAPRHASEREDTPLWLVQAMLLNVIYGHNCGDKTAAELASNHCAALVSLARGAELARPGQGLPGHGGMGQDGNMHMGTFANAPWTSMINELDDSDWFEWKTIEERKRTLYAVFILSSMLVAAYNHPPALTNSEIRLNLPCDEELWSADSAQVWRGLGGAMSAESTSVTFAEALTHLLMAAQRQKRRNSMSAAHGAVAETELRPSTFGCLILVNALHNYIWETRQRHLGRQWTPSETEQMHAHIEPALRAWQTAWASNPGHSLERPNPFGAGPLSADCIPLLDLAYVRLFVNLGRSKEAFWQRDYDAMAEELAKGPEAIQGADLSNGVGSQHSPGGLPGSQSQEALLADASGERDGDARSSQSSRRERYLRKAAFYAADSLCMSDKLGLSFAEHTSRELPMQSAMCAFDCAQVLAEWIATVQERVGRYIGVIGRDPMNFMEVPEILLLEEEDRTLIQRVDDVLTSAELKIESRGGYDVATAREGGHGSRILTLTAYLLERDAVWPVFKLMSRSLETQAEHIKERALASVAGSS